LLLSFWKKLRMCWVLGLSNGTGFKGSYISIGLFVNESNDRTCCHIAVEFHTQHQQHHTSAAEQSYELCSKYKVPNLLCGHMETESIHNRTTVDFVLENFSNK
jgi:hypothetical protein